MKAQRSFRSEFDTQCQNASDKRFKLHEWSESSRCVFRSITMAYVFSLLNARCYFPVSGLKAHIVHNKFFPRPCVFTNFDHERILFTASNFDSEERRRVQFSTGYISCCFPAWVVIAGFSFLLHFGSSRGICFRRTKRESPTLQFSQTPCEALRTKTNVLNGTNRGALRDVIAIQHGIIISLPRVKFSRVPL